MYGGHATTEQTQQDLGLYRANGKKMASANQQIYSQLTAKEA